MMLALCLVLAGVWGVVWAVFLQCTGPGRFLAARRAWLAVVIGVGVDVLILLAILSITIWLQVCAIIVASSIGVIVRSLMNEWREHQDLVQGLRHDQQDQVGE